MAGLMVGLALLAARPSTQPRMPQAPLHCAASPNCVSSDAVDAGRRVEAFEIRTDAADLWARVRAVVEAMPRTRVVSANDDRLHAECRSAVFDFVDDLELVWRPAEGRIAVRSAARAGYWDFGVNRRRVERLRAHLRRDGVIR